MHKQSLDVHVKIVVTNGQFEKAHDAIILKIHMLGGRCDSGRCRAHQCEKPSIMQTARQYLSSAGVISFTRSRIYPDWQMG